MLLGLSNHLKNTITRYALVIFDHDPQPQGTGVTLTFCLQLPAIARTLRGLPDGKP